MSQTKDKVVLDTNILVAAGFNPDSHSARIVQEIEDGAVQLLWDDSTLAESQAIIKKIPPLNWSDFKDLFRPDNEHAGTDVNSADWLHQIEDPADRKFAALADETGAVLISNDDHLLSVRDQLPLQVLTPTEYFKGSEQAA